MTAPGRLGGLGGGAGGHFDDGFDLDGHVQRQRVGADGRARVLALVGEHLGERVRGAVDHTGLGCEAVHAVDKARELDDARDLVQIAVQFV